MKFRSALRKGALTFLLVASPCGSFRVPPSCSLRGRSLSRTVDRRGLIAGCGLGAVLALLSGRQRSSASAMFGAWRCSGRTNGELVDNLARGGLIKSARVREAMDATDRAYYVGSYGAHAYDDNPLPIGFAATISAPHMHASATEDLLPSIPVEGAHILDVGSGSGYLTAVLARIAGPTGRVVGIDYLDGLTEMAENNVRRDDASLLESGRVRFATRDGWEGFKELAPYDCIHVGAAAVTIPLQLVRQLKKGGRMVIPVGPEGGSQELMLVRKHSSEEEVSSTEESFTALPRLGVMYVPLVRTASRN